MICTRIVTRFALQPLFIGVALAQQLKAHESARRSSRISRIALQSLTTRPCVRRIIYDSALLIQWHIDMASLFDFVKHSACMFFFSNFVLMHNWTKLLHGKQALSQ